MESPIRIFMCCHKGFSIVPPLAEPIQGGRAINAPLEGMSGDDGKLGSISEKNKEYCELTVQYYAWKNIDANAYGFCHYRRFFCFDSSVKTPYIAVRKLNKTQQKRLLGSEKSISELLMKYDVCAPRSENMGVSVYEHYRLSKFHYIEDLDLLIKIIDEKAPQLSGAASEYLSQPRHYFCNMFIMKKEYFFGYCELLFDILEEFDARKVRHGDFQSDRADGYLAERFLGIYLTYIRKNGAKIFETARIDIDSSAAKMLAFTFFPPESRRRFFIKKLLKGT